MPKYPIVLAHGLFGFNELHLVGTSSPGIQYWRGIRQVLESKGVHVITPSVPPSGSIEQRAAKLAENIAKDAKGMKVNLIAYVCLPFSSMTLLTFKLGSHSMVSSSSDMDVTSITNPE